MVSSREREPAWLTAKADQLLAKLEEATRFGYDFGPLGVVMMTLTEVEEGASQEDMDRWERTCDNCGRYFPGAGFYIGQVNREFAGKQVIISFGACRTCLNKKEEE